MLRILQKIFKFTTRTFLGLGSFIESTFIKEIIEGWFRQLEWAVISTAILGLGIKTGNTFIFYFGFLSVSLLFLHSILFWVDDLFKSFKKSVRETNEVNNKLNLPIYSNFSTEFCFIFIILLLNLSTLLAIYYGIMVINSLH